METPLDILDDLDSVLSSCSTKDCSSPLVQSGLLREMLKEAGYSSTSVPSYTTARALSLKKLVGNLLSIVSGVNLASYSDKAYVLSYVGDVYMRVAHAFKIDDITWSSAQSSLLPAFSSVTDEDSIDAALAELGSKLNEYLVAISVWLT